MTEMKKGHIAKLTVDDVADICHNILIDYGHLVDNCESSGKFSDGDINFLRLTAKMHVGVDDFNNFGVIVDDFGVNVGNIGGKLRTIISYMTKDLNVVTDAKYNTPYQSGQTVYQMIRMFIDKLASVRDQWNAENGVPNDSKVDHFKTHVDY